MDDLISRQAAIDEIARWIGYIDEDMILRIQTGLKKVPSAQQERKKGKWAVRVIRGNWADDVISTCSECGKTFRNLEIANYCPNCGLPMETEVEE